MSSSYKIPMVVAMAGLTVFLMASPKTPERRLFASATAAGLAFMLVSKCKESDDSRCQESDDNKPMSPLFIHTPVAAASIASPVDSVAFRNEIQEPVPIRSPVASSNDESEIIDNDDNDDVIDSSQPFPMSLLAVIILYIAMLVCVNIAWGVSLLRS